ncbi:sprouty-related, EVH1 domain-containing protein 1-like [Actinia tenebrosa]|uniref:Sprouty-related, EVH1 domain-containing protein 1-like n=1 Tax=Actinia tenebrosa TaxID=6105 RepID=A0A6P8HR21_ACTTE|nr:sprouty-related, EVH1 domain-containing protein 1-like [Actinia tenebrosa]
MKSERIKGLSSTPSYNYYTSFSVKTLPREKDCTDFSTTTTDESDVEEYYPFVIGRGKSFQIVDPKVYKQLRKNNIRQSKNIRIADCAKKTSTKSKSTEIKSSVTSESEDEYCELSALSKSPAPLLPPRKLTQVHKDYPKDSVKTVTGFEKRRQNEYYDPKQCMVQFNSNSSTVTTNVVSSADVLKKSSWKDHSEKTIEQEDCYEPSRKCFCGLDTDEAVDYATCMCCVKGLFYHCTKDSEDEGRIADDPCSCSGPLKTCIPRWGCLAVFSVFLPCLWCFLPITGCRKAAKCVSCKKKKQKSKSPKNGTKNLDFISQKQRQ